MREIVRDIGTRKPHPQHLALDRFDRKVDIEPVSRVRDPWAGRDDERIACEIARCGAHRVHALASVQDPANLPMHKGCSGLACALRQREVERVAVDRQIAFDDEPVLYRPGEARLDRSQLRRIEPRGRETRVLREQLCRRVELGAIFSSNATSRRLTGALP